MVRRTRRSGPDTAVDTKAVVEWAKPVKDDTHGAVVIKEYPNDQLGTDATEMTAILHGSGKGGRRETSGRRSGGPKGSSSLRPYSSTCDPRCDLHSTRSSGQFSRSCASATKTKRSNWQTTPTTAPLGHLDYGSHASPLRPEAARRGHRIGQHLPDQRRAGTVRRDEAKRLWA